MDESDLLALQLEICADANAKSKILESYTFRCRYDDPTTTARHGGRLSPFDDEDPHPTIRQGALRGFKAGIRALQSDLQALPKMPGQY